MRFPWRELALFVAGLMVGCGMKRAEIPLPPRPAEVMQSGCSVHQVLGPEPGVAHWQVDGWADLMNEPRWKRRVAIREGAERKKALGDCDLFMDLIEKAKSKAK